MQTLSLHSCTERPFSIAANIAFMEQGLEKDHQLIKALVEWASLPPSRVASEAGLAATTITRHYRGTAGNRLSLTTLNSLKERFPNFPGWTQQHGRVLSELSGFGERPSAEQFGATELPPIPLLGTALAMTTFDPEKHIELTEVDAADVIDTLARPVSLARDSDAYALTVIGDSMWPRFRPGRRIVVSPRAAIQIGDDVVVQLRGTNGDAESRDRVALVLVKELVRRTAAFVELRQFNPDMTFQVEATRIVKMHKVVGEIF
jgi:hypothetical protein